MGSYAELRGGKQTLPVLENAFSQRVNAIVGKVREARRGPYYVRSEVLALACRLLGARPLTPPLFAHRRTSSSSRRMASPLCGNGPSRSSSRTEWISCRVTTSGSDS